MTWFGRDDGGFKEFSVDYTIVWNVLAALLVIAGVVFTVLPPLPGVVLVLAGLALAAWSENFEHVGVAALLIMVILTGLSYVVDVVASALGAKRTGASPQAIWGAALGALFGLFFGLPGILLGPFIGAMAVQYLHDRDMMQAGRVGVGAWIGMAVGAALKLALAFLMIGMYALLRFL